MQKNYIKVGNGKIKIFFVCTFFQMFAQFQSSCSAMQSMSSKIERAFEKRTTFSIKIRLKRTIIRQLKRALNQSKKFTWGKKHISFCKNLLLYTINNISMILEINILQFSCILKMMSRNTFPEPQPDSASYCTGAGDFAGWFVKRSILENM